MNVAQSFTNRLAKRADTRSFAKWRRDILPAYFTMISAEILQILQKAGYHLACSNAVFEKRIEEYCWAKTVAYAQGTTVSIQYPCHAGTEDDYDWFRHFIGKDTFDSLFDCFNEVNVFDRSPIGLSMRDEFLDFVWAQIALTSSKSYANVQAMRECYEDDDSTNDTGYYESHDS